MKQNRKVFLALALIMLLIASLACGSSTDTITEGPKVSTATSSESENEEGPEPTNTPAPELFLGDAVEKYGYALRVASVQDPAKPGILYTPEEGTKLVAIEIVLSNISGDDILSVNPLYGTLVDSEGFTYQTELGGTDEQISTLDLEAGEKIQGILAFEVPENSVPASIKYSVEAFGSNILQASLTPPPDGHDPIGETPVENPTASLPKLGDVVEQFGSSLTAVTIEDPAAPGMFYVPKEGYKLVAVEIIVGNVSGDTLSVNPLYSYLLDNNGFVYGVELGGRDGQIDTTDINAGEKTKGWVAFMIPEDAIPAGIKYQVDMFPSKFMVTGLGE